MPDLPCLRVGFGLGFTASLGIVNSAVIPFLNRFSASGSRLDYFEGRFFYQDVRYESVVEPDQLPRMIVIPEGGIDLNFHGDIMLTAEEGELKDYVVRFTHGVLEWVPSQAQSDGRWPASLRDRACEPHLADLEPLSGRDRDAWCLSDGLPHN